MRAGWELHERWEALADVEGEFGVAGGRGQGRKARPSFCIELITVLPGL